jgi:hypothetical protein
MQRARQTAAVLMLISGVTHVTQLFVYGTSGHVIGATIFGLVYFAVGVALINESRLALWLGAILPTVGGVLGVIRFITLHANPFTVLHVGVDLVVVPICVYLLVRSRSSASPSP